MMKIFSKFFEETLEIRDDTFYHLIIEHKKTYRKFLLALAGQIDGDCDCVTLKNGDKEIELSKMAVLVSNPLFWEVDEKKVSGIVQKDVASSLGEERLSEYKKLLLDIERWINSVCLDYSLPVSYDADLSPVAFLKAFSVSSDYASDDFLESFVSNIKRISCVFKKVLFFIVNAHDIFDANEIETIFREMKLCGIHVVFISPYEPSHYSPSEKAIVIDSDLAELHLHR